jgi:hypothetical protein
MTVWNYDFDRRDFLVIFIYSSNTLQRFVICVFKYKYKGGMD